MAQLLELELFYLTGEHFRPVAYAIKTLNETEGRYSEIERECFTVTWEIEKFRVYMYVLNLKVVTDHKPLVNIFKPRRKPPVKFERWLLNLQGYTFTVKYQSITLKSTRCTTNQNNTIT